MSNIIAITKRELRGLFSTPIAYVFLIVFVVLAGVFTFYIGSYFDRGVADLVPLFTYLPWLFLVLVPAIAMRTWAEERKAGTIELLMTLPVSVGEAVIGKWLAGFIFIGLALICTMTLWFTANYLGDPDNGVIAINYLGTWILAGVFLAISTCISALTRNQVIAFVMAVAVCFVFITAGTPLVLDAVRSLVPAVIASAVSALSALTHIDGVTRGVIDLKDIVYAVSMIAFWLFANVVAITFKKAG